VWEAGNGKEETVMRRERMAEPHIGGEEIRGLRRTDNYGITRKLQFLPSSPTPCGRSWLLPSCHPDLVSSDM